MVFPSHASVSARVEPPVAQLSDLELAQILAQRLAIKPNDWHRLSSNRQVRAQEQLAAALVFLLKQRPEEALPRVQQAAGWLDRTLKAPPCPTHGQSAPHTGSSH
ncbi:MAG: DUF6439 family protein [Nodosilinea sp.]